MGMKISKSRAFLAAVLEDGSTEFGEAVDAVELSASAAAIAADHPCRVSLGSGARLDEQKGRRGGLGCEPARPDQLGQHDHDGGLLRVARELRVMIFFGPCQGNPSAASLAVGRCAGNVLSY